MAKHKTSELIVKDCSKVIIDTNVLVYIFSPITEADKVQASKYNKIFYEIIENDVKIILTEIQKSEIINILTRREFNQNKSLNNSSFKHFRQTQYYKDVLKELENIFNSLEKNTECNGFVLENEIFKNHFRQISLDYNDTYLCALAKSMKVPVITNDSDFLSVNDCEIYTEL